MTAQELIDVLRKSGTGEKVLTRLAELAGSCSCAESLVTKMYAVEGIQPATVVKARRIVSLQEYPLDGSANALLNKIDPLRYQEEQAKIHSGKVEIPYTDQEVDWRNREVIPEDYYA